MSAKPLLRRAAGLALAITALSATTRSAENQLQFGLRFDAKSSMQWTDGRLFLEGDDRIIVTTNVKGIKDVWPGPVPGVFSIVSDEGVGILMGTDVVPGGYLLDRTAMLRSSRPDTIWAAVATGGVTRIVEWRAGGQRDVFSTTQKVIDFDVDREGRLLVLTAAGLQLAAETTTATQIPFSKQWQRTPERVFVNHDSSELAVYGEGSLLRFNTRTREWSVSAVDPAKQALVRHVQSRRMRIEEKFPANQ